ncbi:MAG: peptidoglycan-binding protein [Bacillota bacterium]
MSIITAKELVAFLEGAAEKKWGYVYSGQGQKYTPELAQKWAEEERAGKSASYYLEECKKWFNAIVVDCSGLLVEAFRSKDADYEDRSSNTFRAQAVERGSLQEIPNMPGLGVWRSGHIGVYIGSGKVIESGGVKAGVVESPLWSPATGKAWKEWIQLRDVEYEQAPGHNEVFNGVFIIKRLLELKSKWMSGEDVRDVQQQLMAKKYSVGGTGADGVYGPKTTQGVKQFQRDKKLKVDGIVGPATTKALGGLWKG